MASHFFTILIASSLLAVSVLIPSALGAEELPAPKAELRNLSRTRTYVSLSFTTTNNPTSINVERDAGGSQWEVMATLPGDATSYRDEEITQFGMYRYRLQVVRGNLSAYSSMLVASPIGPILKVTFLDEVEGWVNLSTSCSESRYEHVLQRREGDEGEWQDLKTMVGSGGHYRDETTVPDTTYQYRLMGVSEIPSDWASETLTVTTLPWSVPPVPTGFRVTDITVSQISLRWDDFLRETSYRVQRRARYHVEWETLGLVNADVTSFTDSALISGETYDYRVSGLNEHGQGPGADIVGVTAVDLSVTVEDDFDPERDAAQWAFTSVTESLNGGTGFNGSKVLWFGHEGTRQAQTRAVDASAGCLIEFSMRAGDQSVGGVTYWKQSDRSSYIVLEYSVDGTSWVTLERYYMHALLDWTRYVVPGPTTSLGQTVSVRWRQETDNLPSQVAGNNVWALDEVKIRSASWDDLPRPRLLAAQQMVMAGSPVSLQVVGAGAGATFMWYKDKKEVPGATQSSFFVASAGPGDAGGYDCFVDDESGSTKMMGMLLVVEKTGETGVQEVVMGTSFSLGLRVHPSMSSSRFEFSWSRVGAGDLEGIGQVTGATTPDLLVTEATVAAEGVYQCRVTYLPDLSLDVGPYEVQVLRMPLIQPVPDVEAVATSQVDIPVVTTDPEATVQVSGLPKGLRYDAGTRRIVGSTTVVKEHMVEVKAGNGFGQAEPVRFKLSIVTFPVSLAGSYQGVFMETDAETAFLHGGQTRFKITSKGAVSGTVMLQGKNHRFVSTSLLWAMDDAWADLNIAVKGPGGQALRLHVEIHDGDVHAATVNVVDGEGAVGAQVLAGEVVRNEWSAAQPARNVGVINVALLREGLEPLPEGAVLPEGTGFLSLKLNSRGVVSCKGRLADGQAVTGSTILGPSGHIPVFMNLYKGAGSFSTLVFYDHQEATGTGFWGKDAVEETSKDRLYRDGIPRHELTVRGGLYHGPTFFYDFFDLGATSPMPAQMVFTGAGLEERGISLPVSLTEKRQVSVPRGVELNPQGITLKVTKATGMMTGKFKLEDENPLKPGRMLRRTVSYQGCLIPGWERGCGYFLLPELPDAEVPRSSLSKTPMWSGKVELTPVESN